MKVILQILSLVVLLFVCPLARSERELKPQHADLCRVAAGSEAVILTAEEIKKDFSAFADPHALTHDYLICGKDKNNAPVLLLHELPGLENKTLDYAKTLAKDFTVYVPLLMGDLYRNNLLAGWWDYIWLEEWRQKPGLNGSTLLTQWLRKLVAVIGKRHPQQSIGIIGNCLTGALPLALLDNKQVVRIVLAQPTLPMKTLIGLGDEEDLAISEREWQIARYRIGAKGASVPVKAYGTRFERDKLAPLKKYEFLKKALGSGFIARQITQSEYRVQDADGKLLLQIPDSEHSSLIHGWQAMAGHPSEIRRQEIRTFLQSAMQ